jgi:cytochrome d ubiquinol oxidase subunit I
LFANFSGWIFTENARQPWAVFGLIKTADGVSPVVSAGMVATTMIGFTVLYGFLAVIEFGLIARTIQVGPAPSEEVLNINSTGGDSDRTLTMAY